MMPFFTGSLLRKVSQMSNRVIVSKTYLQKYKIEKKNMKKANKKINVNIYIEHKNLLCTNQIHSKNILFIKCWQRNYKITKKIKKKIQHFG